jgi:hypothetical protein
MYSLSSGIISVINVDELLHGCASLTTYFDTLTFLDYLGDLLIFDIYEDITIIYILYNIYLLN